MIKLVLTSAIVFIALTANVFASAIWEQIERVDDFDDSRTYVSALSDKTSGALAVRFHESTPEKYEVMFLPKGYHRFCGESGGFMDVTGYANIQVRVDGGEVMTLAGDLGVEKSAVFLKDGRVHKLGEFLKLLKSAKKVVIRFKDNCHKKGQSWVFGKFDQISGPHYLDQISH